MEYRDTGGILFLHWGCFLGFYCGRLKLWEKRGEEFLSLEFWELASQIDLCPQGTLGYPTEFTRKCWTQSRTTCLIINMIIICPDIVCVNAVCHAQGHSSCALGWGRNNNCFIWILWEKYFTGIQSLLDSMFLLLLLERYLYHILSHNSAGAPLSDIGF